MDGGCALSLVRVSSSTLRLSPSALSVFLSRSLFSLCLPEIRGSEREESEACYEEHSRSYTWRDTTRDRVSRGGDKGLPLAIGKQRRRLRHYSVSPAPRLDLKVDRGQPV